MPTRPEASDVLGIDQWDRENVMRKYWSARLNGGYTQTNIIIRDSP